MKWLWMLPDHAQHSVVAAMWMAVYGVPWWLLGWSHPAVVGGLAGMMFYYGREARDAENANPALYDNIKVLWPPNWGRDMQLDFYWPVVSNTVLIVLLTGLEYWLMHSSVK